MRERTSKPWLFAMLGMLLATVSVANAQVEFEKLTFEEAQTKARNEGKIIFVDVMRSGNTPEHNKKVEAEVFTIDSIANFMRDNCVSIRMDMGSEAGKAFIPYLNMLMYPAYVFYDANGSQLQYTNAYSVANNPSVLMEKARASSTVADEKRANTRSVKFEDKSKSWASLLEQAKATGKLIFLDAQTEWCRPCRMMERDIFTLDRVADFYNQHFINVSMDMEKGDGPALVKKYGVRAYPTYLFIDGDGNVVHEDGGFMQAEPFIAVGEAALKAANGQQSITFVDGSWDELLARASAEDKLIFLDGYAVWCGPCKQMEKQVFTDPQVATFFNATYINAKRDMEKGEGITLKERYDVKAYPTYLFINGKGEVVHRIVGGSSATEFLARAKIALDPAKQLASLEQRYVAGERSEALVQQYINVLSIAYQRDKASEVAASYLETLSKAELLNASNWAMAKAHINNPNSPALQYLATNRHQIKTSNAEQIDDEIESVYNRSIYHLVNSQGYDRKALKKATSSIKKAKLPNGDELTRLVGLLSAGKEKNWKAYTKLLDRVVSKGERVYGQTLPVTITQFGGTLLRETDGVYADLVLGWVDELLPTMEHKLDRSKLYDLQQLAYQKAGDEQNALLANTKSKELVEAWQKDNQGSGMMMAVPMKLQ